MKICNNCGKRISDKEYKENNSECKDRKGCEERRKRLWKFL